MGEGPPDRGGKGRGGGEGERRGGEGEERAIPRRKSWLRP